MPNKSKYKAEYCDRLIDHMRQGNSYESFGAIVHVTEETLNNWCNKYPAFKHAKELGKMYELKHWEDYLKNGAIGNVPPIRRRVTVLDADNNVKQTTIIDEPGKFNPVSVIFALKNKFPKIWKDKQDIEITNKDGLDGLSDEEIKRRKELYASIVTKGSNVK